MDASQLPICVLRERDTIIEIEIAAVRRHPREAPSHALLECLDLRRSGARNHRERRIPLRHVDPRSVEMVGEERAARTSFFPSRTQHEVIDDQLAAAVEQVGQRYFAVRAVEDVLLLYPLPRHLAALTAQLIAQPRELLFLSQQFLARRQPLRLTHYLGVQLLARCRCHFHHSFALS